MSCPNIASKNEDNRLSNWKQWMEIRKQFHSRMMKIQNRKPSQLLLNSAEDRRAINEMRILHEYAKIPVVQSERGKPSFWTFPPGSKKFPSLLSVRSKPQDFEVPDITNVAVPTTIQKEKEVLTGEERKISTFFESKYLKKRCKEMKSAINRVQPHFPETKDLMISGAEIAKTSESLTSPVVLEPEIDTSTNEEKHLQNENNFDNSHFPVKSLSVENTVFTENGYQEVKKYKIFLNYNIGKDDFVSDAIVLKNVGEVALRYYWKFHLKKRVLPDIIPHRKPNFCFFFNKSETILIPNSVHTLNIYFKTKKPGLYKEKWELRTEPNVFDGETSNGKFLLILFACAEIADFEERETAIINRIVEGMKYKVIEDILSNILMKSQNITQNEQSFYNNITEKEIFEAVNAKFGTPGSLPMIYHFNNESVKRLKCIYDALKTESDPPIWNYKIDDISTLINKCETEEEKNYYKFTFDETINQIYKTNMVENEDREKFENIYILLCIMIDKMSEKVYELRCKYKIPYSERYAATDAEKLLKQEAAFDINCRSKLYFPDVTQTAIERIQEFVPEEKKKELPSQLMQSLSFSNIDERYKVYQKQKLGDTVTVAVKKGKGKEKGKDKKKKKESASTANEEKSKVEKKPSIIQLSVSRLRIHETKINPDYLTDSGELPSKDSVYMYQYNLYISIYLLLYETVNEIENVLNYLQSTKRITRNVLRTCIQLGIPTLPLPYEQGISELDLQSILTDVYCKTISVSELSTTESGSSILSGISASYSYYDETLKLPMPLPNDKPQQIEMVDAETETEGAELYSLKTKVADVQTEDDDDAYDFVCRIEKELEATSVQYLKTPKVDKEVQVGKCIPNTYTKQGEEMTEFE